MISDTIINGANISDFSNYLKVNVDVHLSIEEKFYLKIEEAFKQNDCESALKLILDLFILLTKMKFPIPEQIPLDNVYYLDIYGCVRNFGNCSIFLHKKEFKKLSEFYNKLYSYRGYICRYREFPTPHIEIMGKQDDIKNLL